MRRLVIFCCTLAVWGLPVWLACPAGAQQIGMDQPMPMSPGVPAAGAPTVVEQPYFDLDAYLDQGGGYPRHVSERSWQLLPTDFIYKSYLAGIKEPRMAAKIVYAKNDAWLWDATLGGRIGLLRYGDNDPRFPQGFQLDAEGAAEVRLDFDNDVNVRAVDFRGGLPMSYGWGRQQIKFGYYHMSSHLGDEFLLKNPGYPRLNWSRDALVLGYSIYPVDTLRLYAETAWAFHSDVSKPWEFQFGIDWAPTEPTGWHGAPFLAVNGHVRQELNYGGNFTVETGWAWMTDRDRHLLRLGMQYYNGKSQQNSFYNNFETLLGFGVWYDY